ncbi:LysR substrate-binding domain-containing protein [Halomonas sp. AOP35-4E-18]|uniref:LysR substrate-binding domain-containing protein n=1 Tax=Halomonas sp. AOP35-4E-18 TaxID=3457686 RepID=UPI00403411CA
MRKRLPSTNALRAFETIMKRKSVKDAADEIFLTPQAVRYQIKMLEELIGCELFIRNGNRLEPTFKATELFGYITQCLDTLEEGLTAVDKDSNKLYLHVSPYYANHILIPRLHSFTEQHPHIDLRISIGAENTDFDTKDIDIAIQWGYGKWSGFQAYPLMDDHKVIAATPDLLQKHPIKSASDLMTHRLISPWVRNTLWLDIFDMLEVDQATLAEEFLYLHDNEAILKATLSGMGVGLVSRPEAIDAITAGDLVAPLGADLLGLLPYHKTPKFYLIRQNNKEESPLVKHFTRWAKRKLKIAEE